MELVIENVRSFAGRHRIPLRPITFLTGENSSGKSTVMAMLAAATSGTGFPLQPAFDSEPYELGSYDTIATYKGGKYGRAKHFCLGLSHSADSPRGSSQTIATYRSNLGQIEIFRLQIEGSAGAISLQFIDGTMSGSLKVAATNGHPATEIPIKRTIRSAIATRPGFLTNELTEAIFFSARRLKKAKETATPDRLYGMLQRATRPDYSAVSISPIRTRPKRTYDRSSETYSPEGDHIPYVLSRLFVTSAGSQGDREKLAAIVDFGIESGLFKDLKIKRFGQTPADPFQLLVTVAGRPANITDVGYGVSQSLPVVVQSVLAAKRPLLLLQQPEVHLHPRAQAALGSFFVRLAKNSAKSFVIETHSDYIIDRVRQEVARGNIDPAQVNLLFFDKPELNTKIYELSLDKEGNILNAPPSYRSFFLKEELNLFQGDYEASNH